MSITSNDLKNIYRDNINAIYKYFFFKTLNKDVTEDLTSETFLILAKQIKQSEIIDVKLYLKGIARNVFNAYLRTKYKSKEVSVDPEILDNQFVEEQEEKGPDYSEMLKKLLPYFPESQRVVMGLRFVYKLTIKEIAQKLGKDENYVSTTQKRAFKTLRKLLECTDKTTNIIEE